MGFASAFGAPAPTPTASPTPTGFAAAFGSSASQPKNVAQQRQGTAALTQAAQAHAAYANSFTGLATNFGKGLLDESKKQIADVGAQGIKSGLQESEQGAEDLINPKNSLATRASGALHLVGGAAGAIVAPASSLFTTPINEATDAATNNRTVQNLSLKLPNLPYGAAGQVAGDVANITGLGAGIAELGKPGAPEEPAAPTKIPVESTGAERTVPIIKPTVEKPQPAPFKPINLPKASYEDYMRSMGYEPNYATHADLPTIEAGSPARSTLPTIKANAPATRGVKGDLTFHPIEEPKATSSIRPTARPTTNVRGATPAVAKVKGGFLDTFQTPETAKPVESTAKIRPTTERPGTTIPERTASPVQTEPAAISSEPGVGRLPTVEGTGKIVPNKVSSNVVRDAVLKSLTNNWDGTPTHATFDRAAQADRVSTMVEQDPERAMRIAMAKEPAPMGDISSEYFTGVFADAYHRGDSEVLRQLANESGLSPQGVEAGRFIKGFDRSHIVDRETDPLRAMEEMKQAREAYNAPKAKEAIASGKRAIRAGINKDTVAKFIEQITCGI